MSVSTTCPRKPTYAGEVAVFRNPLRRSTFLADIAVRDKHGHLGWEPLAQDDPRARAAIAKQAKKNTGDTEMPNLKTVEGRREALRQADVSLRIEDLERDQASEAVFEAWVQGQVSEQEAIAQLLAD
ncbi:antitoxin VbhA family protein (plasmid) [Dyella sp. BiH032]|uniref:antitoxin VbhA family protein n=1 Tax=Dyella sp. BiH032 TaxID=3075430 RepID=UPI002892AEAC|nr:antitoxin VbhA family protein [Dyella sp. BiH032]WNL48590.1 antitoxin VbhA family protein [Dyella sp. BiH032]